MSPVAKLRSLQSGDLEDFFSIFLLFVGPLWNARSPSSDRVESCAADMFQAWSGERGARAGFLKIWRGILRILTSGSSEISKTLIWSFSKLRRSWEQRFSQNTGGMLGDRLRLSKITNLMWISPFWYSEIVLNDQSQRSHYIHWFHDSSLEKQQ